jgi:hypothetical protein
MTITIECVQQCKNHLGEGPVWDVEEGWAYDVSSILPCTTASRGRSGLSFSPAACFESPVWAFEGCRSRGLPGER